MYDRSRLKVVAGPMPLTCPCGKPLALFKFEPQLTFEESERWHKHNPTKKRIDWALACENFNTTCQEAPVIHGYMLEEVVAMLIAQMVSRGHFPNREEHLSTMDKLLLDFDRNRPDFYEYCIKGEHGYKA